MVTSFTRIVVVLSFLRTAIGTQQAPPNMVLISLALFLTAFVMAPTLERSYQYGIAPLLAVPIDQQEAFKRRPAEPTSELKSLMRKSYSVFCLQYTTVPFSSRI